MVFVTSRQSLVNSPPRGSLPTHLIQLRSSRDPPRRPLALHSDHSPLFPPGLPTVVPFRTPCSPYPHPQPHRPHPGHAAYLPRASLFQYGQRDLRFPFHGTSPDWTLPMSIATLSTAASSLGVVTREFAGTPFWHYVSVSHLTSPELRISFPWRQRLPGTIRFPFCTDFRFFLSVPPTSPFPHLEYLFILRRCCERSSCWLSSYFLPQCPPFQKPGSYLLCLTQIRKFFL